MTLVPTGHVDRWLRTWHTLELPAPASSILQELIDHYSERTRSYHTIQHLDECFSEFDSAWGIMQNPGEVELALWFHDAIYDTHRSDNEERSAHWARSSLGAVGASDAVQHRVVSLILATKHNAEPDDPDTRLTVDIDLSILGAARERFWEYERQIRQEYIWVPEDEFLRARAKILRRFTAQYSIYRTEFFRDRLENQARINLQEALARLGAAPVTS